MLSVNVFMKLCMASHRCNTKCSMLSSWTLWSDRDLYACQAVDVISDFIALVIFNVIARDLISFAVLSTLFEQ